MSHCSFILAALVVGTLALPAHAASPAQTLRVDGAERRFELTTITVRPRAIILALHPRPASGAGMRHISDLDAWAEKGGYIVAYPDGVGGGWAADSNAASADEAFLSSLAIHLRAKFGSPRTPIFLVGVSNGAAMAERMMIAKPELFAGVALISGALPSSEQAAGVNVVKPVGPMVVMIGQDDQNAAALFASAETRRARYGCVLSQRVSSPSAVRTLYDCQGQRLEEWRMEAGHVWAGSVNSGPLSWPQAPFRTTDEILKAFDLAGT